MAFNKVLLAKNINGTIEYLYPKTTADMVLCKYGHIPETTVQESLDYISDDIADLSIYKMDSPKNEMGDPVNGDPGQILSINENYEKEWVDYIPNGISTVTIYADRWTYLDYSDRYQGQVVEVSNYNITPNSQVNLQVSSAQAEIFQDNYYSFSSETRTADGKTQVIVFALGSIPNEDYTLQVTVTEVA
jgi:hypothetical protein